MSFAVSLPAESAEVAEVPRCLDPLTVHDLTISINHILSKTGDFTRKKTSVFILFESRFTALGAIASGVNFYFGAGCK